MCLEGLHYKLPLTADIVRERCMLRGSLFQALSEIVGSTELRKCKLETKVGGNWGEQGW